MRINSALIMLTICYSTAIAQKLPNIQQASLRAPADVKIDGKVDEWGNKFQAYNSAVNLFYTLANDEQNLYLTLRTKANQTIYKIFGGGVSLMINNVDYNSKNLGATITFSVLNKADRLIIGGMVTDTSESNMKNINKKLAGALKTIKVKGLDNVEDGDISIYNEYGISFSSYWTDQKTYTCELCIPIKYIKRYRSPQSAVKYTLQSNAQSLKNISFKLNGEELEPSSPAAQDLFNRMMSGSGTGNIGGVQDMNSNSSVTGKYIFAK